jgi:hypothetical protein
MMGNPGSDPITEIYLPCGALILLIGFVLFLVRMVVRVFKKKDSAPDFRISSDE